MGMLLSISLDVEQLRQTPIQVGKNGKKYMEITVSVNDQPNQYGKDVQAYMPQSQEERQAKAQKRFVGGGKVFWRSGGQPQPQPQYQQPQQQQPVYPIDDDLPF